VVFNQGNRLQRLEAVEKQERGRILEKEQQKIPVNMSRVKIAMVFTPLISYHNLFYF
jgi:hypothetical protein